MDTPLLALTSRRPGRLPGHSPGDAAAENMRQLVQLRWIAVAGQLMAILFTHFGLGARLPLLPMLAVVTGLASANLLFSITLRRMWIVRGELLMALLLDVGALTAQLYLSGGATNPFVSLYLLQVVLGAILLGPWMAWVVIALCLLSYAFLTAVNLPLLLPVRLWGVAADLRLIGEWISFAMVAILLTLFITRISRNLRARDAYLAELGQRAAEEDGIVRMGLFASGAAHELSTPLSSLAVLVADWRRDEALARDPRLREELAEAEAEVERCKEIVSDILHSAGRTRGEAMGSASVEALLEDIAAAWRALYPSIALDYRPDRLDDATVAAEPALRQAIWSLLENASDALSPAIRLVGAVEGDDLLISVVDSGTGFTETQLAEVGTPYQSSKGAGHGLGLFLAGNVARRLGGRLEAANRAEGGAVVRMILPLASGGARRRS